MKPTTRSKEAIKPPGASKEAIARHLLDAIEQVREDVARVEFWATAMSGFAEPIPDYDPRETNVWIPFEQASRLRGGKSDRNRKPS